MDLSPWTAALLLILLPESPCLDIDASPVHMQALKDTAHLLDLWSRDGHWRDYPTEVRWCQGAQRDVYGAPPIGDVHRLPSHEVCAARAQFALDHLNHLEAIQGLQLRHWHAIETAMGETRDLYDLWGLFAQATNESCSPAGRRTAMRGIRDNIGSEAYYSSDWPAQAPRHRFQMAR